MRIFQEHREFFPISNKLIDIIMPELSGSTFKVLMVVVRQTIGYQKADDEISISAISKKAGVSNRTAIDASRLLDRLGILTRISGQTNPGKLNDTTKYALNLTFESDTFATRLLEVNAEKKQAARAKAATLKTEITTQEEGGGSEIISLGGSEKTSLGGSEKTSHTKDSLKNSKNNIGDADGVSSRKDENYLPSAEAQADILFSGLTKTDPANADLTVEIERTLMDTGFLFYDPAQKAAAVKCLIAIPDWLDILPYSDAQRKLWRKGFKEHAAEFGNDDLIALYRGAYKKGTQSNLTITHPGALTHLMQQIKLETKPKNARALPDWMAQQDDVLDALE